MAQNIRVTSRQPGCRPEPGTVEVWVGRRSHWRPNECPESPLANPYPIKDKSDDAERAQVIAEYRQWLTDQLQNDPTGPEATELMRLRKIAERGAALRLRCVCAPKACHADVIREMLMK